MLENVSCNLCGADHYKVLYARPTRTEEPEQPYLITQAELIPPARIVKCLRCGFVYANPQRPPDELKAIYAGMVDEDYLKEEKGRRITARRILKRVRKHRKQAGRLLDVGCATGILLDEAKKQGWEVSGVEISKWACGLAKNNYGLDVFCVAIEEANFPALSFDAVILTDTIEHLNDPKRTLFEIRRILKPEGILYISTPDIESLSSKIFKARWWGVNQFHLYYFNRKTLGQVLQGTGFRAAEYGTYTRTFSFSYLLQKLKGYNAGLYNKVKWLSKFKFINEKTLTVNFGDQISVVAKKRRAIIDLPEIEKEKGAQAARKMKVTAVLPAYNAAKTLARTVADIPRDVVDEIILVDDCSHDNTVEIAKELGLVVFKHEKNRGYGGNQKTCYTKALERGADIVVMVHPDYQYDPKAIPAMVEPIKEGRADAVFGSRMLKGGALEGGMPLWKHNTNIIFTAAANVILGTYLTEYHSGFRAYSAELLRSIRYDDNSDNFIFDVEIIVQIVLHYFKIDEVPIHTRYFEEASVIKFWAGCWYSFGIFKTLLKYVLHKNNINRFRQFE